MRRIIKIKENVIGYGFISPFLFIFILFMMYPIIYSLYLSFHHVVHFDEGGMQPVGFSNYHKLFQDRDFWWSVLMTAYYAILSIPLGIFISLVLAVLLHKNLPGRTFFRTAYFLPNILDVFVVALIWFFIYYPHGGLLTRTLELFNIHYFSERSFLGNPITAMPAVVIAVVLKSAGFGMILFLAAIQNISQSIYEAADIDGANGWQKFRYVTIPLVKPITLFLAVIGTIASLNAFVEVYAMTGGGPTTVIPSGVPFFGDTPVGVTKLSGYYLFHKFYEAAQYGYAAAISYIILLITIIVSIINFKLLKTD